MAFNNKGEISLVSIIFAVLTVGLFIGLIAFIIDSFDQTYDTQGYDSDDISKFNHLDDNTNLSAKIIEIEGDVESVVPDRSAFDFFADIFGTLISPLRLTYNSYKTVQIMSDDISDTFELPSIFAEYFSAIIVVIVVIGIVFFRIYLNRR